VWGTPDRVTGERRGRLPARCNWQPALLVQNEMPMRATTVRGCRKCVPLKVERKLYSATLLARLAISKEAVYFM